MALRLGGLARVAQLTLVLFEAVHDAAAARRDAGAKLVHVGLAGLLGRLHLGLHRVHLRLARSGHLVGLALQALGEGAVVRFAGIPPYEETQGYVTRVLSYYRRYRTLGDPVLASSAY